MECLVLRHLSGSKAEQVDRWPLAGFREVLIGRDPAAAVRYDSDRDDSVSRRHARLKRDPHDAGRFLLVDLDSRNGTFVNRRRVQGSVVLSPGDRVQLGPGGPEFEVAIESVAAEACETSSDTIVPVSETAAELAPEAGETVVVAPDEGRGARVVVRVRRTARVPWLGLALGALVVALLGVALGARVCRSRPGPESSFEPAAGHIDSVQAQAPISAVEIARRHGSSVCRIEVAWSLVMAETGGPLYHEHQVERDGQGRPVPGAVPVPVYVRLPDGHVEPALALDPGDLGQNQAIGGLQAGSGFSVTQGGLLLTGRQVVAPWTAAYSLPAGPGVLVSLQATATSPLADPPRDWVPIQARAIGRGASGTRVAGRLEQLEVVFPAASVRAPGQLRGTSPEHDVAVVEIDVLRPLDTVEPGIDPVALAPGAQVTVLGYASVITSSAPDGRVGDTLVRMPATIGPARQPGGTVGETGQGHGGVMPGEAYELAALSADPGTRGGPVFDDRGRLAGILSLHDTAGASRAFVLPIRFGLDLLRAEQSRR